MQQAVIAVADAQAVLEGLDVDVGRVGLDGALDDAVDHAYDGGLGGEVLEPFGALLQRGVGALDGVGVESVAGIAGRVEALEGGFELDRGGDGDGDLRTGCGGDGAAGEAVERVDHGERGAAGGVVVSKRQGAGAAQETRRESFGEHGLVGIVGRADDGQAEERGVGAGHVAFRHQAELDEDVVEPLAAFGGHASAAIERARIAMGPLGQDLGQALDRVVGSNAAQWFVVGGHRELRRPVRPCVRRGETAGRAVSLEGQDRWVLSRSCS